MLLLEGYRATIDIFNITFIGHGKCEYQTLSHVRIINISQRYKSNMHQLLLLILLMRVAYFNLERMKTLKTMQHHGILQLVKQQECPVIKVILNIKSLRECNAPSMHTWELSSHQLKTLVFRKSDDLDSILMKELEYLSLWVLRSHYQLMNCPMT